MVLSVSKRELLARAFETTGCSFLLRQAPAWSGLLVLNYHRIGDASQTPFDPGLYSATEEDFERQVRFLIKHFDVIGLSDLPDVLQPRSARHRFRRRFVMLTFDDGYRDNYFAAYPILRTHNAPAVFFLATGFLDRPSVPWWDDVAWMVRNSRRTHLDANVWTDQSISLDASDRPGAITRLLKTYKTLGGHETCTYLEFLAEATGSGRCPPELASQEWMTWDMVREMHAGGMDFGAHTVHHPILANLSADEQSDEVGASKKRIECELGEAVTAFSYPVGKPGTFNAATFAALQQHGFRWAFSYSGGYCHLDRYERFQIPRVAVEEDVSFSRFQSMTVLPQLFGF